jgi:hypothetical protein
MQRLCAHDLPLITPPRWTIWYEKRTIRHALAESPLNTGGSDKRRLTPCAAKRVHDRFHDHRVQF